MWARVVAVGLLLLLAGVGVGTWAAGLDDVQRLDGPVGLPAVWAAPADPALVGDRPLEAASLAVAVGQDVVLVSADGRGYRRLRRPVDGPVRLSPDGRSIAWLGWQPQQDPDAVLWIARLADGAASRWIGVRPPPGNRPFATSFDWAPDSSRLIVTGGDFIPATNGGERTEARLWDVDARTGAARLLCECGDAVRSTAEGRLVQVPRAGATDVESPLPPGAVRLPAMPPTLRGAPLADPDGRRWVAPAAGRTLTLMGADGVARSLRPALEGRVSGLLAWTRDGIWVVVNETPGTRVGLLDPSTGAVRTMTLGVPGDQPQDALTVATGVIAGGAVVAGT